LTSIYDDKTSQFPGLRALLHANIGGIDEHELVDVMTQIVDHFASPQNKIPCDIRVDDLSRAHPSLVSLPAKLSDAYFRLTIHRPAVPSVSYLTFGYYFWISCRDLERDLNAGIELEGRLDLRTGDQIRHVRFSLMETGNLRSKPVGGGTKRIVREKVEPAAKPKLIRRKAAIKREARGIPVSQFGRVRTLTKYGMTKAQVAEL
jgi:hypothetical protein